MGKILRPFGISWDIMFTGIIKNIGTVQEFEAHDLSWVLVIDWPAAKQVPEGASIAINGVCLTAASISQAGVRFDVMPETIKKTTIGLFQKGDHVNIERTLCAGDEIGGHFVYGHVDTVGTVTDVSNSAEGRLASIELSHDMMQYMVQQGSIALDGVSLTIARLHNSGVTVSLVSYTVENTTLGEWSIGQKVNVEADMLAKYVMQRALA